MERFSPEEKEKQEWNFLIKFKLVPKKVHYESSYGNIVFFHSTVRYPFFYYF